MTWLFAKGYVLFNDGKSLSKMQRRCILALYLYIKYSQTKTCSVDDGVIQDGMHIFEYPCDYQKAGPCQVCCSYQWSSAPNEGWKTLEWSLRRMHPWYWASMYCDLRGQRSPWWFRGSSMRGEVTEPGPLLRLIQRVISLPSASQPWAGWHAAYIKSAILLYSRWIMLIRKGFSMSEKGLDSLHLEIENWKIETNSCLQEARLWYKCFFSCRSFPRIPLPPNLRVLKQLPHHRMPLRRRARQQCLIHLLRYLLPTTLKERGAQSDYFFVSCYKFSVPAIKNISDTTMRWWLRWRVKEKLDGKSGHPSLYLRTRLRQWGNNSFSRGTWKVGRKSRCARPAAWKIGSRFNFVGCAGSWISAEIFPLAPLRQALRSTSRTLEQHLSILLLSFRGGRKMSCIYPMKIGP